MLHYVPKRKVRVKPQPKEYKPTPIPADLSVSYMDQATNKELLKRDPSTFDSIIVNSPYSNTHDDT
jgi:hypothetical protein